MEPPSLSAHRHRIDRRNTVTLKLLFIAGLVLVLQFPLHLVNGLRQERVENRVRAAGGLVSSAAVAAGRGAVAPAVESVFDAYRMVERSLKHSVLVLALVFSAFFLFEIMTDLRLHAVHYGLVSAALCLFYLALLALGEVMPPGPAYIAAATSSSSLIVLYSAAVLRTWNRAGTIAGLLAAVHGTLYVVLRMEEFALLAGTGTLFVALALVMFFTRHIDWQAQEAGTTSASVAGGAK